MLLQVSVKSSLNSLLIKVLRLLLQWSNHNVYFKLWDLGQCQFSLRIIFSFLKHKLCGVEGLTYKLFIQKISRRRRRVNRKATCLYFAVIDTEKDVYPLNYICVLPKSFDGHNHFCRLFKEPIKTAVKLLTSSKKEYNDFEFKEEIDHRLRLIKNIKHLPLFA